MSTEPQALADPEGPGDASAGLFALGSDPDTAAVVIVPVPFDATASYGRRAAGGPAAILAASVQLDLYDPMLPNAWEAGIAMLPSDPEIERLNRVARDEVDRVRAGGAAVSVGSARERVNAAGAEINDRVGASVREILGRDRIAGVVGGDHSTPFAAIAAHIDRYPELGVLHIDAHADLRDAYEGFTWSHASIMHNVVTRLPVRRLVQVGIRDYAATERRRIEGDPRIVTFFADEAASDAFSGRPFGVLASRVVDALPADVYVSFDIDGLDPIYCPHTGTPVPGGLSFREVVYLLREIVRSGRRVVGFDLTEVAPGPGALDRSPDSPPDPVADYDGNVGARMLYQLSVLALASR